MFSSKDIFFTPPSGGYRIEKSLRFRSSASAYLSRTPSSAGNRRTWTWSGWLKRGALAVTQYIYFGGSTSTNYSGIAFGSGDTLIVLNVASSSTNINIATAAVFRDPSAWYHFVIAADTTQATNSNGLKIWVNGVQQTLTFTTYTQNADFQINNTVENSISGSNAGSRSQYFDGYLAEVNFIDGQALTPSSFGETDATTGVWKPKAYTGTHGTNGFYLKFTDVGATSGSNTGYGQDFSGNTNRWTTNNFGTTSTATTYDSMWDTPTPYNDGGNGVGNYATYNPLNASGGTLSNANLTLTASSSSVGNMVLATIASNNLKYYFEVDITKTNAGYLVAGVQDVSYAPFATLTLGNTPAYQWVWRDDAFRANSSASSAYGTAIASGGTIAVAVDPAGGKIWWGSASGGTTTWFASGDPAAGTNAAYTNLSGVVAPCVGTEGFITAASVGNFNAGQRPFVGSVPSGFKALNTQNLPTPTIAAGDDYFNVILYTGTGASNARTGVGFQPDFVWIKERNAAADHGLYDAVRGVQKQLESNTTTAETTETTGLTAFSTDGFTVGALAQLNTLNDTYVAWNWKGGNGTSSIAVNAYGSTPSIASTVSANTTAGFSVVTYTGTGGTGTVGHGIGVAPSFIIVKERSPNTDNWNVYHASLGNQQWVQLNTTAAQQGPSSDMWNSTSPTSTVFTVRNPGSGGYSNRLNSDYVAYCFAAVAGFSAFGSYTGNGSADGPFVFLGFRPRYVMVKRSDSTGNWFVWDGARDPYNTVIKEIYPDSSSAETTRTGSNDSLDFVSNGFKIRFSSTFADRNANGGTYIYAAFAENPFKFSLAR